MFFKQKTVFFDRKTLFIAYEQCFWFITHLACQIEKHCLYLINSVFQSKNTVFHLKNTVYREKLSLSSEKQSFWKT